jgi:AraC-like DNA-binding protein
MLTAKGCDAPALFRAAGLDLALARDPNQRYPVSGLTRLWRAAVKATGDPCIGLEVPRYVQPATMHALGLSIMASETLYEALLRSARFSRIITDAANVEVIEQGATVIAIFHAPPGVDIAQEGYDGFMATSVHTGRLISLNEQLAPLSVDLRRAPPEKGAERYAAFFKCPVHFNQPQNRIVYPLEMVQAPLPMANAQLVRQNDQVVAEYLARFDRDHLAHQVRDQIIKRLPTGEPGQNVVARALHLSLRSLQRKLSSEGTSFSDLLEETRRELASQYLKQSRIALCEITYLLGFTDQSNFTRAFKRWTGVAPGEFRERHLTGGA